MRLQCLHHRVKKKNDPINLQIFPSLERVAFSARCQSSSDANCATTCDDKRPVQRLEQLSTSRVKRKRRSSGIKQGVVAENSTPRPRVVRVHLGVYI